MHHNVQLCSDVTFQHSNSYFYIDFIYYKSEWVHFFFKKNPSWILFCSNVRQPCTEKKLWEFFKKSKFFPEKCTYLSQICFIKIWTAYLSNWDTVKALIVFFSLNKMTEQKTNFGVHGHIHVTGSPKCFFHNKLFFSPVQPPECKQRKTVGFIFRILFLQ